MPNKNRKPKLGSSLNVSRKPFSPELPKIGNATIVWLLGQMDFDGEWSWAKITMLEFRHVHAKLKEFEKLTWAEASTGHRPRLKRIPVERICREAQQRLAVLKLDDTTELYELHINGKRRVWGLRQEPAFMPLWWDPEHTVCPSELRNT